MDRELIVHKDGVRIMNNPMWPEEGEDYISVHIDGEDDYEYTCLPDSFYLDHDQKDALKAEGADVRALLRGFLLAHYEQELASAQRSLAGLKQRIAAGGCC